MNCLNCGQTVADEFCTHCGQSTATGKITLVSIASGLVQTLTNAERGIFYNIKNLTIAPHKTILGYIEGKRVHIYPPLSYAAIMITLLVLVDVNFTVPPFEVNEADFSETPGYKFGRRFGNFLKTNLRYTWYLNIFLFALPTALIFRKYNLAEHIIINAFIFGHAAFLSIILFPILPWSIILNPINYLIIMISYFIIFRKERDWIDRLVFIPIIMIIGIILFIAVPIGAFTLYERLFL